MKTHTKTDDEQQNRVRILRENAATRIQAETEIEQQSRLRILRQNATITIQREKERTNNKTDDGFFNIMLPQEIEEKHRKRT